MRVTPAEDFLRKLLSDGAEHLSEAVQAEAKAQNIPWRNVERARAKIADLTTYQRGFKGPWVMRLTKPKPPEGVYSTWPEYTAVTCRTCGRIAGMYHQPENITCNTCAQFATSHNPSQTATTHLA